MRAKTIGLLAILAATTSALALGQGAVRAAVGGPTCNVPADYPTIQLAVNDPGCSTIRVAPGTYNENVSIARTLTLKGAQAGRDVSRRTSGGPGESTIVGAAPSADNPVITVDAANVTVDGFTVRDHVTSGAALGFDVKTNGNAAVIANNIIDGIDTADTGGDGTAQGVFLDNGPDSVHIVDNEITNVKSARSAKAVLIGVNGGTNPSVNTLIRGNAFSNITSVSKGAYGVSVANVTGVAGLRILGNDIRRLSGGGWVHAIGLEGDTPGVIVRDNAISGLTSPGPDVIAVWFENEDLSFASGHVNNNNLDVGAGAFGIAVHPALNGGPVDGTCNWWGSRKGPTSPSNPGGTGSQVSPKVTFAPWLTKPARDGDGACNGGKHDDGQHGDDGHDGDGGQHGQHGDGD